MNDYSDSFEYCFKIVVGEEGGYVNNPQDPGGETKYGISKRAYPYLDIASLTVDHAKDIYHLDYWEKIDGDVFQKPLALCLFDSAVNQGIDRAIRLLQSAVGADVDGVIGPQTRVLVRQMPVIESVNRFMADRAISYSKTQNFDAFGKGWMRRLFNIHTNAARIIPT